MVARSFLSQVYVAFNLFSNVFRAWTIPLSRELARLIQDFHEGAREVILQNNDIHIWLESDTGKLTDDFLREVLGRYLDIPAQQMRFARTANGKPYLLAQALDQGLDPLQFNVSHSQGKIACAVSKGLCLGIDIENSQRTINVDEVAQRYFHPREVQALQAIADTAQRRQLFFKMWTCKEAYIKATGQTIAGVSLQRIGFDCSGVDGSTESISALFELPAQQMWHFHTEAHEETVIAVAQARHCAFSSGPQVVVFAI